VPTKPETGYGYIERDGDNVLSFRENQIKFQERLPKETFCEIAECSVLKQVFY
jgi:mannose-1-phosphate guanylyltransferase